VRQSRCYLRRGVAPNHDDAGADDPLADYANTRRYLAGRILKQLGEDIGVEKIAVRHP